MARLFLFAIGGTGSRVLKSLTMLLAAGIKPNSAKEFEIVPIIIDPHNTNEDLKRTERLLNNYQYIAAHSDGKEGFFSTRIQTLDNLVSSANRLSGNFMFNLQQVSGNTFSEYIEFNQLDDANRSLMDILFSGTSINNYHEKVDLLDIKMDIGFVGNPNVGSVVLNQFKDSDEFKEFASNFNQEDRIFIISSIFGGTGAAGFPTILKNIRNAKNNPAIDGKGFLQDSKIGALTVLPYFNLETDTNSPIQKSDFIAKTRAALHYYKDNLTGNHSINALYYIGDDYNGNPYQNDPGDHGQQNKAHFVELAAALGIIDFIEIPDAELHTVEGKAIRPIYKEFGIKNDAPQLRLSDLEIHTEQKLALRLSQLELWNRYLQEHLQEVLEKRSWCISDPAIDKRFLETPFYRTYLSEFLDAYKTWIQEMGENRRGFEPFQQQTALHSFIKDKTASKSLFSKAVDFNMCDDRLNTYAKGKAFASGNQKLLQLFFETTEDILTTKFGL